MVSAFVNVYSVHIPAPPSNAENSRICADVISPRAEGRHAVRRIIASIFCSIRQLMANAAPASSQMPTVPPIKTVHGTMPGVARNMPMTAQKTASCVTRGLVNAMYCERRLPEGEVSVVLSIETHGAWRGSDAGTASRRAVADDPTTWPGRLEEIRKFTITSNSKRMAAPPLCATAMGSGHCSRMFDNPVRNCTTITIMMPLAGFLNDSNRRSFAASHSVYSTTTIAKVLWVQ